MFSLRQLIDFYLFGRHRLETVELLPLGRSVDEAVRLYGPPLETEPFEEIAEITQYTFATGPYHQAVILEWKQTVQSITYWSMKSDPARDLGYVLDRYREGGRWRMIEEGYWYQREDGKLRLWCSAMPAIGVAYVEFLTAKAELEKANSLKQLSNLADVTWAPDDAVFELQRRFVQDQDAGLTELASRSDKIAVSPDGRHVFIVREHHAYDVEDGFQELNAPPEDEQGFSTQVINCFTWSEDSSLWGKIVLPRDANVDSIRFDGEQCHLRLRNTATDRVLTFRESAASILRLGAISIGPHHDSDLWKGLEAEAEQSAEANGPHGAP